MESGEGQDMEVVLHAEGHVRREVTVQTFEEASKVWVAFRDENNMGARDMQRGCGNIQRGVKKIGSVSYNGRVWDAKGIE